jgi:hypothetical protein
MGALLGMILSSSHAAKATMDQTSCSGGLT